MGFFGPSKEKVESAIEQNIKLALEVISQEVGVNKLRKFKSSNPGVVYGFCYGVATHTWILMLMAICLIWSSKY